MEMLRRGVDPTYEAIHIEGEIYALSSGRVYQWKDRPHPEFIPAGDERGEEVRRWLVQHSPAQHEGEDKDAAALRVLHEIVDPHAEEGGVLLGEAVRAAQERGVSQIRATKLLKDPSHFRLVPGKSRKEGIRIFPLVPTEEVPEEPEDKGL
jgi:hypothetical protein